MNYIGVFQGGGVKGIAHIGALKALEERGFFCYKAAGTSVGAIIASLLVAGYKSDEMIEIVQNLDLTTLRHKDSPFKAIRELGMYSSIPLVNYLDYLYKKKGVQNYLDFKEGNDYRLKVIATDITRRKQIIFPNDLVKYHLDPDSFKIATSVVMSATYPLFYKPFKIKNSLILDGAIVNNFPLDVFGYEQKIPIIGFNLIGEMTNKTNLNSPYIIRIPIPKVKTMNFKIDDAMKKQLYLCGYNAGKKFLNQFFH